MLTTIEKLLFLVVVASTLYYAWRNFRLVYLVIRRGTGDFPSREQIVGRLLEAGVKWLSIRPIWKTRTVASIFHGLVAWGFIFYLLVNAADVLQGYFPIRFLGDNPLGSAYRFLGDIFSVAALVGMLYFLVRRFVLAAPELTFRENVMLDAKVKAGGIRRDSLIVGIFILLHVGSRFVGESFAIAQERLATGHGDAAQPFANALSLLWGGLGATALTVGQHAGWWLALGLILAFLPYFPYTKHFHLMLSGVNFLTKPQRASLGALEPENFEDESIESFGAARLEDLPWTHLADAYACIMCNRCQDVCPAYVTGKELSPSALEVNKRYYINGHMQEIAAGAQTPLLLEYVMSESALWACTACGACVDICPVGNEPMFDILYMRRHQVLMENSFPHELQTAYRGMERNGNPWNLSRRDRMKWAGDVEIPTVDDNPDAEILWWVGCAPSYDPRAQQTALAFAKVLNHAGVNYAVLGDRESCTGDSARRSGREDLFYEMATANIETLNEVKPKRIVATCPHCLHTLGKEYGQYGGHYEVIHHTQLLSELVAAKKLSYDAQTDGKVTFHDPCYLGRHNGIVDAPRSLLEAGNIQIEEMPRHGAQSFCCGAGGGQMWKEEEPGSAAVNKTRYDEARATGAKTIAVGCPFCLTMMTDAAKSAGEGVAVKDVVELIAESLER